MLQAATIRFLKDLKQNNYKEWFDANRDRYDAARDDFAGLVKKIIDMHGKKDESIAALTPKDCMFCINRDIRFSKDKTPYKTNFGASMNRGGKKSIYAGYYLHCEAGEESFVGGGLWMPEAEDLKKVRQEIDYAFDEFKGILTSKKFIATYKELYRGEDSVLSREPKGYEKDNPAIEYIKFKSFVAMQPLTEADFTSKDLLKKIGAAYETLQPMIEFINRSFE